MKFVPSYTLNIIKDTDFARRMEEIRTQLNEIRVSGDLITPDGVKLFYEYFLAEDAVASVVILHGMSEFTCKHYELAYYLLQQGYNVFMYDQRCHGRSQRLTDRPDLIHVDRFLDFVEDLELFVQKIVLPAAVLPLHLYGHSMGGAVAIEYLAAHPDTFQKAVLSSPLFEPIVGAPTPIAAISAAKDRLLRGAKSKLTHSREFIARIPTEWLTDPACSRNKYMMQLRIDEQSYQTTPMTAGFALRALYLTPRLLKLAKRIRTPHLLISGDQDTVVKTQPHRQFAERSPLCHLVCVPGGKHAMMCDDTKSAAYHTNLVLDFLKEAVS